MAKRRTPRWRRERSPQAQEGEIYVRIDRTSMRGAWLVLRESSASKGLGKILRITKYGLLPLLAWLVVYTFYSFYGVLRETLGGVAFIHDFNFAVLVAEALLVSGLLVMTLVGFVRARAHFGLPMKTLFLFCFGLLIPLAAAFVQYEWYLTTPESFAFDEAALASVGQEHTAESIASMRREIEQLMDFRNILEGSIAAIADRAEVGYLDSAEQWGADGCRRLDLGSLSDHVCVVKELIVIPRGGVSAIYWPVIRQKGSRSGPDDLLQLDSFLTGEFACPVPNDFVGGGGLNFLRHQTFDSSKLRACLGVATNALTSRITGLIKFERRFKSDIVMPSWYFYAASVMAFVGSDLAFVQPVGLAPVAVAVLLAVFRFFYFAVVVTLLLEPISRSRADP